MTWDRDAELAAITPDAYPRAVDRIVRALWVYAADLDYAGVEYATLKTDHDRLLARGVVQARSTGEKSAEVAASKAIAYDDAVYASRLRYRLAEQRITQCREAMRILHAQLDDQRTQAADRRAGDRWHADDPGQT